MSVIIDRIIYDFVANDARVIGYGGVPSGSLVIPDTITYQSVIYNVRSIKNNAFLGLTGFTGTLTIGSNVHTIGSNAFNNCSGFTGSLTIPNSVTSIGTSVFYNCRGFTGSLTIPNSITSIGAFAFYGCNRFTGSLTIPNSITSIGDFAFYNCTGFTGSLTIPNSVTSIGANAFNNCPNLVNVIINNQAICSVQSNSFTNVSSNPNSSIQFVLTYNYGELTGNWPTISGYYATVIYEKANPTITNFSIPTKNYGDLPFEITEPDSNSSGSFSYSSSNLSVATIVGNIITIVGVGSSTITATQEATTNYNSGTIDGLFEVNPAIRIEDGNELLNFMGNTSSTYCIIENPIELRGELIGSSYKILTVISNNISITTPNYY